MKLITIILGLLISLPAFSQDLSVKRKLAESYFNSYDFYKAIPVYEELLKSRPEDGEIYGRLAAIYDHLNDSQNAEKCYSFLVKLKDTDPANLLNYARALARNGKYSDSRLWYSKFRDAQSRDKRGTTFSEAYTNLQQYYRDSSSFRIVKSPFSSTADDFSPAYFGTSIVFPSDRSKFSMIRKTYNWTQSPYLDLYWADSDSGHITLFSKELNSVYHEGPMTFSTNSDTIIFTRSNYFKSQLHKSSEGITKLSLFQAVWDSVAMKWKEITPLNINNDQYSVEHPALSPDGRNLYFASDMPGGSGGFDLYVSERISAPDGRTTWGTPVNLGPDVNSEGNEMFPFIDRQGNLWFASNGIPGLGGLDIFFAARKGKGYSKPVNPGYPLNTRFDDFGLITDHAGEKGYFSSDRYNHYGNDDIYSFSRKFPLRPVFVYDAVTKQGIPSSKIGVAEEGVKPEVLSNETAKAMALAFNPLKSYELSGMKEGYKTANLSLTREDLQSMDTIKIPMVKDGPRLMLSGYVYAANDKRPLPGYSAMVSISGAAPADGLKSDEMGIFLTTLRPGEDYRISVVSGTGERKCYASPAVVSTRGIAKDTTINLRFPVYCEGDLIALEGIYYDLDKYNIRPDAALILDKLLALMNEYPGMIIELRSHTDSRASAAYNLRLSENRAKAAAEYLFSKGIAKNRIIGKGYGETMLVNKCSDGVQCSEEEHQRNRRTEFKIISME